MLARGGQLHIGHAVHGLPEIVELPLGQKIEAEVRPELVDLKEALRLDMRPVLRQEEVARDVLITLGVDGGLDRQVGVEGRRVAERHQPAIGIDRLPDGIGAGFVVVRVVSAHSIGSKRAQIILRVQSHARPALRAVVEPNRALHIGAQVPVVAAVNVRTEGRPVTRRR